VCEASTRGRKKKIDEGHRECKNPYIPEVFVMPKKDQSPIDMDRVMKAVERRMEDAKKRRIKQRQVERAAARGIEIDSIGELLRAALEAQPSLNAVEKATGVKRQSLSLFLQGRQASLRLPAIEKLAEYFRIECSMPAAAAIKKEQKNG